MRHTLSYITEWGSQQGAETFGSVRPDTQLSMPAGNYSVSVHSPGPGQEPGILQSRRMAILPPPRVPFCLYSGPLQSRPWPWGLGLPISCPLLA